jgi:hypothetical protein
MVVEAAAAIPATLIKSRRFIAFLPLCDCCWCAFVSRLGASMEHPVPDFHAELNYRNAKSPASLRRPGFVLLLKA